ncbi:beta-fructofuranosidase [Mucilaginibacter oryzae]|uniref:beta-fructofuranosidase n=1 Tax=Mucilaginibacter oryzae TaxID=468058 RepID=A0A316HHU0_9SPHI|nr:glycoside hydrolase family 32 protein [Mucilaginibacter oryzae]PWK79703.1 beta-fructofuranosidase [Mucilaginibacter oryzae]
MNSILNRYILAAAITVALMAGGCKKDTVNKTSLELTADAKFNIYPKAVSNTATGSTKGWVGDVMPYYVNGQFELFYLHDAPDQVKQSSPGQHDIHKFSSKDLLNFSDDGEAIPYGNANTQDNLIGTGSMIKVGDTYYYYYTGFNGNANWLTNNNPGFANANTREAVMYATSKDLKTWTKKSDYVLRASTGYSGTDFRDPYVFYNDEFSQYWMLVSTQQNGKGVVLVYTADDLASNKWTIKGPLTVEGDYLMLECSQILKINGKYFMLFAEDWTSTPGTHYRVASTTAGPWLKPADGQDMFDGYQFYAGRETTDGAKYYAFGWAHRRTPENDGGTLTYAGNMIAHEVFAIGSDKLGVRSPASLNGYFGKQSEPAISGNAGTVSQTGGSYSLNGSTAPALYKFGAMDSTVMLRGTFNLSNVTGTASIGLNTRADNSSTYVIKMEPANHRIAAYNNGKEVTRVPFTFEAGKAYNFSLVMDASVAVLYVNDQVALSNRVYSMAGNPWSLSADMLNFNITNLKVFKH